MEARGERWGSEYMSLGRPKAETMSMCWPQFKHQYTFVVYEVTIKVRILFKNDAF